ncbi:hypothetical protein [Rhizobium sp. RU36D]|uniref:hypothetical protein n=1 Tax=Rhizobium sp. RU36D TaxID=1907415 RepID=UPI0009D89463|nr:hypothetical protein [Rhizobium sp. RU36D]SMD18038.1 hypothetical protein SAMN05880593_1344 [Rhizobium sp. RU36D]
MEELAKLPPLAIVTFGAVLAMIFGVRYLGLFQGRQVAPPATKAAEVAAVIVDPAALNRASAAVEAHTDAVVEMTEVGRQLGRMLERMHIELDRIREELRIQREIARRERER